MEHSTTAQIAAMKIALSIGVIINVYLQIK